MLNHCIETDLLLNDVFLLIKGIPALYDAGSLLNIISFEN